MNLDDHDKKTYTQLRLWYSVAVWSLHETKQFNSVVFQFIIIFMGVLGAG